MLIPNIPIMGMQKRSKIDSKKKKKKKKKIAGILASHFPNLMEKLSIHLMNSKLMNSKLNIFKVIYTYLL